MSLAHLRSFSFASSVVVSAILAAAACGGSDSSSNAPSDGTGPGTGTGGGTGTAGTNGKAGASGGTGGKATGGGVGVGGSSGGASAGKGGTAGATTAGSGGTSAAGQSAGGSSGAATGGSAGTSACGDTQTDPKNCGTCGHACPTAQSAQAFCVAGKCELQCVQGFAACDGNVVLGCKVDTNNDPSNCGSCGHVCPKDASGSSGCYGGKCGIACTGTMADCDADPTDGCEVDTNTDPNNCGTCGKVCSGQCISGACQCAGVSAAAQRVPLDMYVMLDRSGSMDQQVPGGMTRWQTVTGALEQFFSSPSSSGIGIALQYFPQFDASGTSCDVNYYYTPDVQMAPLPGSGNAQVNALQASITAITPAGGTPTNIALAAAVKYAADWKSVYKTHTVVVVLSTDGEPGDGCNADINNSSMAAADGLGSGISTYVIGVGSNLTNLDAIANAGGTSTAFIVNDGDPTAFIAALQQIQSKALGCEYALPPAPTGGTLDLTKVNVEYTAGGGSPTIVKNVASMSACDAATGGWYYDNPATPTKIVLCPETCGAVQNDTSASIDIILGCDTEKM